MKFFNAQQVTEATPYQALIPALELGFCSKIEVPQRLHYDMETSGDMQNPGASRETTLLLMPAWQAGQQAGVKIVTVAPQNVDQNMPSIQLARVV